MGEMAKIELAGRFSNMNIKRRNMNRFRRGFTLIELLIVIAILLAMGGLVVVNVIQSGEKAKADLQLSQFDQIHGAMKMFKFHLSRWPTEEEGLAALWDSEVLDEEEDIKLWAGPYLEDKVAKDQWGNDLIYKYPGQIRGEAFYDLISIGPDREEATGDDINNHARVLDEEGEVAEEFEDFEPADSTDDS